MDKMTWEDFRDSGLLWFINRSIHLFGVSIVMVVGSDGKVEEVYPARTKWRGFQRKDETDGFKKITKFIDDNISDLVKETN